MEFADFINSKDISEYHKKIGYEYNSLEAAWLVSQCRRLTLKERHEAWQWIIDNMPDQIVKNGKERNPYFGKSLHKTLTSYMMMQKLFINEFKYDSGDWHYAYKPCYRDYYVTTTLNAYIGSFTSWEKCVDYIIKNEEPEDTKRIKIGRGSLNDPDSFKLNGTIEIDLSGQLISADFGDDDENFRYLDRFFEDMWFEFPVPFKPGDIVCLKDYTINPRHPIVLTDIVFPGGWDHDEWRKNRECGDSSDMLIWGYYIGDSCSGECGTDDYFGILSDSWWNYMDVEYYPKELTGCYRALKPVSSWIKGELGEDVALLVAAYHRIMVEEEMSRSFPNMITEEGLRLAGLMKGK